MDSEHLKPEAGWCGEIGRILEANQRAEVAVASLYDSVWKNIVASDVWPRELPDDISVLLSSLRREIEAVRQAAQNGLSRYQDSAVDCYLKGRMVSREQYHLLAAMGIPVASASCVGLSDLDD